MTATLPPAHDPLQRQVPDATGASVVSSDYPRCLSCGATLTGRFCAECGEKRVGRGDYTLRHVLGEVTDQFLSLDGRALRTVRALVTRPGFLTAEYLAGRRRPYSKPLSLFLLLNVVFFLAAPHLKLLQYHVNDYLVAPAWGMNSTSMLRAKFGPRPTFDVSSAVRTAYVRDAQTYVRAFNAALDNNRKSLLIFLIPALALVVMALQARRRRAYVEHLVFSVHTVAALLLLLLLGVPLVAYPLVLAVLVPALRAVGYADGRELDGMLDPALGMFIAISLAVYLFVAMRRVYGDGRWAGAAKAVVLAVAFMALFQGYRSLLFLYTYHTL